MKPLFGLTSDAYAIGGRHRKPYLVIGAAFGVLAWSGLAMLAATISGPSTAPLWLLTALLFGSNLSTALSDVIVDAMVAERCGDLAREAKRKGTATEAEADAVGTEGENALQSLCWGSLAVGGLSGSLIGMSASSYISAWAVFALAASCPSLVLIAAAALTEAPHAKTSAGGVALLSQQVKALWGALRLPAVWRPLLFFFLQNALVPSTSQAMLFFSTDVLHFSPSFLSAQGVLGFGCLLLGSVVYSRCVQGAQFLKIFYVCQATMATLSLADIALVTRSNIAIGVPDAAFVLGSDAVATVVDRLMMQPFFVIAARLCPPGVEASLYAFFMSTFNFGNAVSGQWGGAILPLVGVSKGHYDGLCTLLMLRTACMCLPLVLVRPLLGGVGNMGGKE